MPPSPPPTPRFLIAECNRALRHVLNYFSVLLTYSLVRVASGTEVHGVQHTQVKVENTGRPATVSIFTPKDRSFTPN